MPRPAAPLPAVPQPAVPQPVAPLPAVPQPAVPQPAAAKDLLQETMYRALANQEKYSVGTNIKAWLYTIMRNIFINNYRRKSKQNTIFDNSSNDFLLNYNQHTLT